MFVLKLVMADPERATFVIPEQIILPAGMLPLDVAVIHAVDYRQLYADFFGLRNAPDPCGGEQTAENYGYDENYDDDGYI